MGIIAHMRTDSPPPSSEFETLDSPPQSERRLTATAVDTTAADASTANEAPSGYEAVMKSDEVVIADEEVARPGEAHQQSLLSVIARKLPIIPPLRFTELELGPTAADEARARVLKAALATAEVSAALNEEKRATQARAHRDAQRRVEEAKDAAKLPAAALLSLGDKQRERLLQHRKLLGRGGRRVAAPVPQPQQQKQPKQRKPSPSPPPPPQPAQPQQSTRIEEEEEEATKTQPLALPAAVKMPPPRAPGPSYRENDSVRSKGGPSQAPNASVAPGATPSHPPLSLNTRKASALGASSKEVLGSSGSTSRRSTSKPSSRPASSISAPSHRTKSPAAPSKLGSRRA